MLPPVRDQGQRGTCLAFAVTAAHEMGRAEGDPVEEDLSEEALYWGCKVVDGQWRSGTRFASAAVAIGSSGQPLDAVWPYDPTRPEGAAYHPPTLPNEDWYKSGLATAALDLAAVRAALDGGRPVLLGVAVFDTLFSPTAEGRVEAPPATAPRRGRHAVLAVGYETGALLIRNSWGTTWALGGYAWLSDEYVERHANEAWVLQPAPAVISQAQQPPAGDVYGDQ